jgi:glycosyltransferase involved in cell wall biosynthesis
MPNQPATLNERYSSPNKLYESIAVGTPVVGSDFPERRRIVTDDPDGPLGTLCDPTDPHDLARALSEVLELDPVAAEDLRRRCHRAAQLRWNWEIQSDRLLALYARLAPIGTDVVPARS